jgi:uncharacterized membrane protein
MACCVFQRTNLVDNDRPRKSARTFVSRQKASNKLYTVLCVVFSTILVCSDLFQLNNESVNGICHCKFSHLELSTYTFSDMQIPLY